jgi:hypothetical protein
MVEHPIGLNIQQNFAFLERVFWHMVGVVNVLHQERVLPNGTVQQWQEIGTSAACTFNGNKLLLTAKHVLDGARTQDLAFLVRPTGRIELLTNHIEPALNGYFSTLSASSPANGKISLRLCLKLAHVN